MSTYGDKLRVEKKTGLSQRISHSIAQEIWEMSWQIETAEEFVDYLMTITDQEAIEEFFNKCHDDNGRFCGGSTGSRGLPGKDRGPGTSRPAPVDYYKDRIRNKMESIRQRGQSKAYKKVTVGPIYGGLTAAVWGNVKVKKLAETDLKKLSTGDLVTLRSKLKSDQRFYNNFAERSVVWLNPTLVAASVAMANWKTTNIPKQIDRVDAEVKTRFKAIQDNPLLKEAGKNKKLPYGIGASDEEIEEFQVDDLVAAGDKDFSKAPESVVELIAEFLLRAEEDDDISPADKKKIKSELG